MKKIEEQLTSLELSKELKEADYEQSGVWWWVSVRKDKPELFEEQQLRMLELNSPHAYKRVCVAPTVVELGERLPIFKQTGLGKLGFENRILNNGEWIEKREDTEANARAKMWLYLKKEVLIKWKL